MSGIDHLWAVIPAGGAGTRLWPLSRSGSPKFLHDLTGQGSTLLQDTRDRVRGLVDDRVMVVTGSAHREAVLAQLPDVKPERVVAEPSARDSMAAIGLAAAILEREDPEAVMGSFAADHVIADPDAFARAVTVAVDVAREDWLVTIGIEPTSPSSAFGYIHLGDPLQEPGAYRVSSFVEKPSTEVAQGYLASGDYRWNAGMFVVRPRVLLDLLASGYPAFAADLRALAAAPETLDEVWERLPRIAVDHAIAESAADAGRVAVVPADIGWDDVGDYDSLTTLLPAEDGLAVLGDAALVRALGATGLVVPGSGRMVAVVGLDDVVVVDTPDALLVTTRAHAQRVKDVVAELKQSGRADLA